MVNNMVKNDKRNYFNKIIENNKDTATIWKAMNTLTNNSKKKKTNTKIDLHPNKINDYFLNISNTILSHEAKANVQNYTCPNVLK